MSRFRARAAADVYNVRMSTSSNQRTTILTAVATFIALTVITIGVWAFTRPTPPPAAAAAPVAEAAAPAESVTFDRIEFTDFKAALDKNEITVLDVRTIDQYAASHIPGALQIPLARVEGEIPYLPKNKPIVTYCTCPNEESSGEAAMILARGGIDAKALKGGLGAWTDAGYPTATGMQ